MEKIIRWGEWQSAHTLMQNFGLLIFLFLIFHFANRENILSIIHQSLPPQEGGLLGGILVGDKNGFEKGFYEALINSGLVHLVVVSGSNVMLLVGGWIESLAGFLGRKRSIVFGLILGWRYVNLVSWEIPVVRAMILMTIMYWAQLWGRKFNVWRSLVLVVIIMMIGEIRVLLSVSFWLSMLAFLGILTAREFKLKWWQETLWVSVWISPIMGMVFGKISLISPITNALVLGSVEYITVVGAMITAWGGYGMWVLIPALKFLAELAEWGGRFPVLNWRFNWYMLLGWYIILFYFLVKNKTKNF